MDDASASVDPIPAKTRTYENDLFLRAARGEKTPYPPIWLMRQAGRMDPEYLRIREAAGLPLEALFRHPAYAAQFSILPLRFGVDALIYYQDILTPLAPMGASFVFRPGPILEDVPPSETWPERLQLYDVPRELPFIKETFDLIFEYIGTTVPVLGFAGAPLTLAAFLLEGKSPTSELTALRAFARAHPQKMTDLLNLLTDMTIAFLRYQIQCGAAAVQLFESIALYLSPLEYRDYALPYQTRIFSALRGTVPTILFARSWSRLEDLAAAGADILSLPSTLNIRMVRRALGAKQVVQGNLDNTLLAHGTLEEIEYATRRCVEEGERYGHIFNLSHGVLPSTPLEHVLHVIGIVKSYAAV